MKQETQITVEDGKLVISHQCDNAQQLADAIKALQGTQLLQPQAAIPWIIIIGGLLLLEGSTPQD